MDSSTINLFLYYKPLHSIHLQILSYRSVTPDIPVTGFLCLLRSYYPSPSPVTSSSSTPVLPVPRPVYLDRYTQGLTLSSPTHVPHYTILNVEYSERDQRDYLVSPGPFLPTGNPSTTSLGPLSSTSTPSIPKSRPPFVSHLRPI